LGLKGNLEMTLASRFSTQVNIGLIKDRPTVFSAVMGNIALTQVFIIKNIKSNLQ
jgi:solute carrier family 41